MMRDKELTGLAMTLGRDRSMKITVGGDQSYCTSDGGHINIAKMPLTPLGRLLTCGLIFHELGHKQHTTGDRPPGLLGELTNAIEDVRTEALTVRTRPGTRYDLEAVTRYYLEKTEWIPSNAPSALLGLTLVRGRRLCLGQKGLEAFDQKCCKTLEETLGIRFTNRIESILEQGFMALSSTDDAREMAKRLIAELRDEVKQNSWPKEPDEEGEQNPAGANNAQDESESTTGELDITGSDSDSHSDKNSPPEAPGSQKPGQKKTSLDSAEIEQMIQGGTAGEDLSTFLTRELDDLAQALGHDVHEELPELPEIGRIQPGSDPLGETEAICTSSRMRSRLMTLLQAVHNPPESFGCSGRKLDTRRLVRMAKGDPRLFKKRIEVQAPNTAVMVLLDSSGSMAEEQDGVSRSKVANQAAFALHHALFTLCGVSVASVQFALPYTQEPCVNLLAGFTEKPRSAAFNISPEGGTPTHSALWAARALLLQRREPRKILLILTDGFPSDPGRVKAATRRCASDGIQVAAIGIETDTVRRYWKNHRVVRCLAELPAAMFGVMEGLLVISGSDVKKEAG